MARALRVEYSGAVCQVMSRGDRGEAIYLDDKDREMFLDCLEEGYEALMEGRALECNHKKTRRQLEEE